MTRSTYLPVMVKGPLLAALLLVVVGAFASLLVLRALVSTQERHLRDLAQQDFASIEASIGPMVVRDDVWEMFDLLDRVTRRDEGLHPVRATLVDPLGRVVISSAPDVTPLGAPGSHLIEGATPFEAAHYDFGEGIVLLRQVLHYQGRALGQMVIEFDATNLLAERRATIAALVAGNAGATLLAALVGFGLMRRVLRPVSRLTAEMSRASGTPHPIPESAIPRRNPEIAQLYDTYNALLHAVEERNAAAQRLADRERFVSLGRLAGTMAHEVNNPLGGLMNAVDTLRRYPDRPEVVASSADLLERGLKHLRDVTRATLDMHRDGPGTTPLTPADLEDLNLLIRPEAERRGQNLHWQVAPDEDCLARLPAGPLRQIALNLLLNAAAVAGHGGEIGLRLDVDAGEVLMAVQDSGPGLPDHLRPRLLSDAPVEPGGGVGLRLVRELVQGLDGRISLGHSPEGLNEIRVHLPCARREEGHA